MLFKAISRRLPRHLNLNTSLHFSSRQTLWKIGLSLFLLIILGTTIGGVLFLFKSSGSPLLSPISNLTTFQFFPDSTPAPRTKKIVYGFLPYWNIHKVTVQPELTHMAYFSLTFDGQGTIISQKDDGSSDMGMKQLQSDDMLTIANQVTQNHGHNEIVFANFTNDDIVAFLGSAKAQDKLLHSMDSVLLAYPFEGINIDIEYTGEVTSALRAEMSQFMDRFHTHIKQKYKNVDLSIDVYAYAGRDQSLWEMDKIPNLVDHMIVMAYDFHHRSSIQAGPVAPLLSGDNFWESSISDYLKDFLEHMPPEKILLGVPFYGYEWQTVSDDPKAMTYPKSGATASVERVQSILEQKDQLHVEEKWNDDALSPYLVYHKDGKTFLIYYENSRSLSYKLDLVNQLNLGGIAIWALGYEKDSRELWDVINKKN